MEPVTEADRAELDRPQEKWELPARNKRDEEVVKEEELNPKMIGVIVVIDLFLASLGAIGIYLYKKLGKSVLTLTGFHCGDESLAYPYHSSTIPAWLNAIVGVFVPVIIVVADRLVKAKRNAALDDKQSVALVLWKMFPTLIAFLAGCSLQHIFTDVAKYQVGRLRPHFLEVCQPAFYVNDELVNCSSSKIRDFEYIPDFECTSTKFSPSRQKEARISFPSGHCSFAFYAMTFAFIYSHFQLPKRFTTFLGVIPRPFVQFSCLWWAWFVGISRLFDNKHHASDILAGSVLGALVAAFFGFVVLRLHEQNQDSKRDRKDTMNKSKGHGDDWH